MQSASLWNTWELTHIYISRCQIQESTWHRNIDCEASDMACYLSVGNYFVQTVFVGSTCQMFFLKNYNQSNKKSLTTKEQQTQNQKKPHPQPYWLTEKKAIMFIILSWANRNLYFHRVQGKEELCSLLHVLFCICALINHCSIFQIRTLDHITFESYGFLVLQAFPHLCLSLRMNKIILRCTALKIIWEYAATLKL